MKLLLDESLPKDLRLHLPGHHVSTVPERGWASRPNGDPLQLAGSEFDAFLTADQNLEYQQNPAKYNIAIVVLAARSNRIQDLVPLVPRLLQLLPDLRPGQLVRVAA
jgi:hypothetical protein